MQDMKKPYAQFTIDAQSSDIPHTLKGDKVSIQKQDNNYLVSEMIFTLT